MTIQFFCTILFWLFWLSVSVSFYVYIPYFYNFVCLCIIKSGYKFIFYVHAFLFIYLLLLFLVSIDILSMRIWNCVLVYCYYYIPLGCPSLYTYLHSVLSICFDKEKKCWKKLIVKLFKLFIVLKTNYKIKKNRKIISNSFQCYDFALKN